MRPQIQPSTSFHLEKDACLLLSSSRTCPPSGSLASVINTNKTEIPPVSACLVGGFNEDCKYQPTAHSKKKKQT